MFYYGHMDRSLETSRQLCVSILFSGVAFRKDAVGVTFLTVPFNQILALKWTPKALFSFKKIVKEREAHFSSAYVLFCSKAFKKCS